MASLGVANEIRDRVLNHADRSVVGVHYNRYDYLVEKRAALDLWARKLAQIVGEEASTGTLLGRVEKRRRRA